MPLSPTVLRSALARGRAAWPHVRIADDAFFARLKLLVAKEPRVGERFANVCVEDLFLAFACLEGDRGALSAFHSQYLQKAPTYIRRYLPDDASTADVVQDLGQRLLGFVAGEEPKLARYSGLGPLGAFVRVAAVRLAQTSRRTTSRRREDEIGERVAAMTSPELLVLKKQYASQLAAAMHAAIERLGRDERDALRLHYYDGLSLEEIAAAFRVSRATAARRIASARESVMKEATAELRRSLGPRCPDMASLYGLVKSDLNLGLSRVLK